MRLHATRCTFSFIAVIAVLVAPLLPPGAAASPHPSVFEFQHAVVQRLQSTEPLPLAGDTFRAHLEAFYAARGGAPTLAGTPHMYAVIERLRNAADDGLDAQNYPIADLEQLSQSAMSDSLRQKVETEIAFAASLMAFAFDLRTGRLSVVPQDVRPARARTPDDAVLLLDLLWTEGTVDAALATWMGRDDAYGRLKTQLSRYRSIARSGGWPQVPGGGTLRPGMSDDRILAVRSRLAAEGEHPTPETDATFYDPALEVAVRRFQAHHGLAIDGAIGPATLKTLNVDAETRVRQIVVNMERRRWSPVDPGSRHIVVNIAGQELTLIDGTREPLRMAVIIGKPGDETPLLNSAMAYLDLNPFWYVPRRIALEEEVPKLRSDPARMQTLGFELVQDGTVVPFDDVDWSALAAGAVPFRLRQRPGPRNALGKVKFIFPNPHHVYLHDTPSRHLFRRPSRAFSHGCIRVHRPIELAEAILRGNEGWSRARIDRTIASGKARRVPLTAPLPVYLTYETAWVDEDGALHFRDDIYGRDSAIVRALSRDDRGRAVRTVNAIRTDRTSIGAESGSLVQDASRN